LVQDAFFAVDYRELNLHDNVVDGADNIMVVSSVYKVSLVCAGC